MGRRGLRSFVEHVLPARRRALRPAVIGTLAGGLCCASGVTLAFVWPQWQEVREIRARVLDKRSRGFINVGPPYFAPAPGHVVRHEQNRTYLWTSTARDGTIRWMEVTNAAVNPEQFALALGFDAFWAIDDPIFVTPDHPIVRRMRPQDEVLGLIVRQHVRAYPVAVLQRVGLVNDKVGGAEIAVFHSLFGHGSTTFRRRLGSEPLTFGLSGYTYQGRMVLFERNGTSLWYRDPETEELTALCGSHCRMRLTCGPELQRTTWQQWQADHPGTRVLVGADRGPDKPFGVLMLNILRTVRPTTNVANGKRSL
ncbi:MAG: DUF3179 domain-containing (seleno)protein [Pirellulales bacterium]